MMEDESPRRKLGMCNYCQDLGQIYEQENAAGVPTFLVCRNCITDIFVGINLQERAEKRRQMRWRLERD